MPLARIARPHRIVSAIVVGGLFATACGRAEFDDPTLASALDQTLLALETRNMEALWGLTDPATQDRLLKDLRKLESASSRVPEVWTGKDVDLAREAMGAAVLTKLGLDDPGRGPRALGVLLDATKLTFDEGTRDGLGPRDVTYEAGPPRRALILTSAGERFAFVSADGRWASLLVRDLILDHPSFKSRVEHAEKTLALRDQAHAVWVSSSDPSSPQGAYNLARTAQNRTPADLDMLFALLDTDARAALREALELGRKAQRDIQQRVNRAERRTAYEAAGIARLVDASSDRDLFFKWASTKDWKPLLPATDPPERVEGDSDRGTVMVLTQSGARVPMTRDPDGIWRLGGLRAAVLTALGPPTPSP
jgi:hypothetical protein